MQSKISGKKILITGGTGFIASHLIERFYPNNRITVFDNGRRNAFSFLPTKIQKSVTLIKGDIRNKKDIEMIVSNQDIILHLAAIAGISFYEKDPLLTLEVNLFGAANLLQSLIGKRLNKIIIFSSSEVYGSLAENVSEQDLTCVGPISEARWSYAISKLSVDHLAIAYFKKYSLPITIVRPFNIYGPRQVGEGAISNMVLSAIKENKIHVTGKGSQMRAWCYVSDLVDAILKICQKKVAGETFNIGSPKDYLSIWELAQKIHSNFKDCKLAFDKARSAEILKRLPDIKKAKKLLEYKPEVNLDEGLKMTIEWFKKNVKAI